MGVGELVGTTQGQLERLGFAVGGAEMVDAFQGRDVVAETLQQVGIAAVQPAVLTGQEFIVDDLAQQSVPEREMVAGDSSASTGRMGCRPLTSSPRTVPLISRGCASAPPGAYPRAASRNRNR